MAADAVGRARRFMRKNGASPGYPRILMAGRTITGIVVCRPVLLVAGGALGYTLVVVLGPGPGHPRLCMAAAAIAGKVVRRSPGFVTGCAFGHALMVEIGAAPGNTRFRVAP